MATYGEVKASLGSAAELGMLPGDQLLDPVSVCGSAAEFTRQAKIAQGNAQPNKRPAMDWYTATAEAAAACADLGFELDYLERRALFEMGEFDVLQACIDNRRDLIPVCLDAFMDCWFTPVNWPWGFTKNPMAKSHCYRPDVVWTRPAHRVNFRQAKLRLARRF